MRATERKEIVLTKIETEVIKTIRNLVAETHHEINVSPREIRNRFIRDCENLKEAVRLIDCFLSDAET